ncbi:hypothetical protein [Dolichospermum circinale]|nr:hypothetical protein [Dolichospermum circinale]MDB9476808.1 hypothetical protein [Dolichospermum circinale CS-537/11]MDB9480634.1 hypothetical protein [Dolichospermum circinale CS-537/03]MDB9492057.1 hypothetical protein [Dolichospermum circinale CS-534/05]
MSKIEGFTGLKQKMTHQLPITNYQLPITNYPLPITQLTTDHINI